MMKKKVSVGSLSIESIFIIIILTIFFVFLLFRSTVIIYAATPTPFVLPVNNTPDPQNSTLAINFTCDNCNPANSGELVKLYICNTSSCTNCTLNNTYPASNPTFATNYPTNCTQVNPQNTLAHDNSVGYILCNDTSSTLSVWANWTWNFISSTTGNFSVKWYAKIEPYSLPGPYEYNVTVNSSVSNDGNTWTLIRSAGLLYPTTNYTNYFNDTIYGTYRYIRVGIYSNATSKVNASLNVDYARVSQDNTSYCYCNSSAVSGSPWCTYTNSTTCKYGVFNYWGRVCAFQYPWPWACNTTEQKTFTFKKNDTCTCAQSVECFSGCCQGNSLCGSDCTLPTYSLNSTNSTTAGAPILHSLNWTDNVGLSGYIFSWNSSGRWDNATWTTFGANTWSNVTNTSNSTAGLLIQWCFYANDTSNNWNGTSCQNPFSYITITGDTSPPQYSYNNSNTTTPFVGDAVLIYANWTDNVDLDWAWLWTNETGTGKNWTSGTYGPININLTGTQTWSNFTWKNSSVAPGTIVTWKIYANDSAGNENVTGQMTFTVQGGTLDVRLIFPSPGTTTDIDQNSTFTVNATVYCRLGNCSNVNGTIRYNASSPNPDTPVNGSERGSPFFVNEPPYPSSAMKPCPTNPLDDVNEFCNLTWTINASGNYINGWTMGVLFNSSVSTIAQNHTDNATKRIVQCLEEISISWSSIDFGPVSPSTRNNEAPGNDDNTYNITNKGTCTQKVWIKGTDLENRTLLYPNIIGVGNLTWSNTTNVSTSAYQMTNSYVILNSTFTPAIRNITTYYWLSVPAVYAGRYNGNMTICWNTSQESGLVDSCA
jgi:hypothetical protein